ELVAALCATREVGLERRAFLARERVERVRVHGVELLARCFDGVAHRSSLFSASSSRSFARPERMRVFTVPAGSPSRSAASESLLSAKYASSSAFRQSTLNKAVAVAGA